MRDETLSLLKTSLRRLLTEESSLPLRERLDDLGWDEVIADDAPAALCALFEIKGEVLSAADALGPRLVTVIADSLDAKELTTATIVLPVSLHADQLPVFSEGPVSIAGIALEPCAPGALMLVPMRSPRSTPGLR